MIVALTGFVAGLGHVLSGPDHLAALAPFTVDRPRRALNIGVQWAIGHSIGVVLIALGSLLLRELIPIHLISSYSERAVGLLLIAIGLWGIRKAFSTRIHAHHHVHDGEQHTHIHVHRTGHRPHKEHPFHSHSHTALGIGTLHGLAGGSHLLGVLPALALPSQYSVIAYLAAFAIGTVAGIGLFSSFLGLFAEKFGGAGNAAYRYLMCGCSTAAVAVGGVWLVL